VETASLKNKAAIPPRSSQETLTNAQEKSDGLKTRADALRRKTIN